MTETDQRDDDRARPRQGDVLGSLFLRQSALPRHRATVFGPHLDGYLGALRSQGYQDITLRQHLYLLTRFGEFLDAAHVQGVRGIKADHVAAFVELERARLARSSRSQKCRRSPARLRIQRILEYLGTTSVSSDHTEPPRPVLDNLCHFLATERGLRPTTIKGYRDMSNEFLRHLGSDGSVESLAAVTAHDVDAFLMEMGQRYSRRSMRHVCTAVRALLRYLHRAGILRTDLSVAVIMPKLYALERLPCALPWDQIRRVLEFVDRRSVGGKRDTAILMLLTTYGVRPGEIVKLRLEDIDWRHDTIVFQRSKSGAPLHFPLTRQVGEALVAYLQDGRPFTPIREVFIRVHAPCVGLKSGVAVGQLVNRCFKRAGIKSRRMGAYLIRHSLAVHLLRCRYPLKTISDVLGHRDPRVVYHYTKLSVDDLREVALDGREVLS